jgi:hypothetical protein
MGYDVHITRAEHWTEAEDEPISLEQWKDYLASDPEMRPDKVAEAPLESGGTLRYESEGLAVWTAWPGHGRGGNFAWFDHRDGEIVVKNPDEAILAKMCSIAEKPGARVQGDDGEEYPEDS